MMSYLPCIKLKTLVNSRALSQQKKASIVSLFIASPNIVEPLRISCYQVYASRHLIKLLAIHVFSALSLQLKKIRWCQQRVSRGPIRCHSPAVGNEGVRRSTGHIIVTTRNAQTNRNRKSSKTLARYQPPDSIGNFSASRRCLWVRSTVFTFVRSGASGSPSELHSTEKLSGVLPIHLSHLK